MDKQQVTVLAPGALVRVDYVDMYGFWGREHHPHRDDVGRIGRVLPGTIIERDNRIMDADALSGYVVADTDTVLYTVELANGYRAEFVHFELRALP